MRRLLILFFMMSAHHFSNAQSITPKVQNSGGTMHTTDGISLTYSVGEISIKTFSSDQSTIESGFLHNESSANLITQKDSSAVIKEDDAALQLFIYPNPASNKLHVSMQLKNVQATSLQITDVKGNVQIQQDVDDANNFFNKDVDISKLQAGFYIVKLLTASGVFTSKFIKQ